MGDKVLFGVYGYPKSFLESPLGKNRVGIFEWLHELNLNALLLDWTYGISMTKERAKIYRNLAKKHEISLILRAPKDIDFISDNEKKQSYSLKQLKRACSLATLLGVKNMIVSLGSGNVLENREDIKKRLILILKPIIKANPSISFHIEPALKRREYGSLEEIISLCRELPNCYPSFNLMHLHAWNGCNLIYPERIIRLLKQIEEGLGKEALKHLIVQICPVSYEHGRFIPKTFGEMKTGQLSFFDSNFEYFPKASDYITAIRKMKLTPITISNTYQTEEVGAMRLRDSYFYQELKERQ